MGDSEENSEITTQNEQEMRINNKCHKKQEQNKTMSEVQKYKDFKEEYPRECRICAAQTSTLKPIFSLEDEGDNSHVTLADEIAIIYSTVVYFGDPLPQFICTLCLAEVESIVAKRAAFKRQQEMRLEQLRVKDAHHSYLFACHRLAENENPLQTDIKKCDRSSKLDETSILAKLLLNRDVYHVKSLQAICLEYINCNGNALLTNVLRVEKPLGDIRDDDDDDEDDEDCGDLTDVFDDDENGQQTEDEEDTDEEYVAEVEQLTDIGTNSVTRDDVESDHTEDTMSTAHAPSISPVSITKKIRKKKPVNREYIRRRRPKFRVKPPKTDLEESVDGTIAAQPVKIPIAIRQRQHEPAATRRHSERQSRPPKKFEISDYLPVSIAYRTRYTDTYSDTSGTSSPIPPEQLRRLSSANRSRTPVAASPTPPPPPVAASQATTNTSNLMPTNSNTKQQQAAFKMPTATVPTSTNLSEADVVSTQKRRRSTIATHVIYTEMVDSDMNILPKHGSLTGQHQTLASRHLSGNEAITITKLASPEKTPPLPSAALHQLRQIPTAAIPSRIQNMLQGSSSTDGDDPSDAARYITTKLNRNPNTVLEINGAVSIQLSATNKTKQLPTASKLTTPQNPVNINAIVKSVTQCPCCPHQAKSSVALALHQVTHLSVPLYRIGCRRVLHPKLRRGRIVPGGVQKMFRCLNCWRLYPNSPAILEHWMGARCRFYCGICGESFHENPKLMRDHYIAVHNIPVEIPLGGATMSPNEWSIPRRPVHDAMMPKFNCNKVQQQSVSPSRGKAKKSTATNRLPNNIGATATSQSANSNSINVIKHPIRIHKPVRATCDICKCSFPSIQSRNSHMRLHKRPRVVAGQQVLPSTARKRQLPTSLATTTKVLPVPIKQLLQSQLKALLLQKPKPFNFVRPRTPASSSSSSGGGCMSTMPQNRRDDGSTYALGSLAYDDVHIKPEPIDVDTESVEIDQQFNEFISSMGIPDIDAIDEALAPYADNTTGVEATSEATDKNKAMVTIKPDPDANVEEEPRRLQLKPISDLQEQQADEHLQDIESLLGLTSSETTKSPMPSSHADSEQIVQQQEQPQHPHQQLHNEEPMQGQLMQQHHEQIQQQPQQLQLQIQQQQHQQQQQQHQHHHLQSLQLQQQQQQQQQHETLLMQPQHMQQHQQQQQQHHQLQQHAQIPHLVPISHTHMDVPSTSNYANIHQTLQVANLHSMQLQQSQQQQSILISSDMLPQQQQQPQHMQPFQISQVQQMQNTQYYNPVFVSLQSGSLNHQPQSQQQQQQHQQATHPTMTMQLQQNMPQLQPHPNNASMPSHSLDLESVQLPQSLGGTVQSDVSFSYANEVPYADFTKFF